MLRSRAALVALFLLPGLGPARAVSAQTPQDETARASKLATARSLLGLAAEREVNRGARMLEELNSPASVAVLLEALNSTRRPTTRHLAPAHYRDIAWGSLTRITDFYAQSRVDAELRKNKKNAFVRQWCAELLGIYREASFAGTLIKALRDRDKGVKRWAARSLGMIGSPVAVGALSKLVTHRDRYVRANAIEALARIDGERHRARLERAVREDRDGGVRCAMLLAAGELMGDEVEALSARALEDRDWRPRMQGVDNLGRIRTKTAVDALIRAVRDGRPVVGERAVLALQKLTGQSLRLPEIWERWWKDNRATFHFPEGPAKLHKREGQTMVAYHGIRLVSDHVAFLIDRSKQMEKGLVSKGTSKREAARLELEAVLDRLVGRLVFNVFAYAEEVEALARKPLQLSKRNGRKAVAFITGPAGGQAKDIWQVLERVIADPTLDTAYLLSSGEPDIGTYVHWNRVTRHLADFNRFHKVTVHTICYSERKWFRDQLEKIADVTGGEFHWFE